MGRWVKRLIIRECTHQDFQASERLLHSHSVVAVVLSVRYQTLPPIDLCDWVVQIYNWGYLQLLGLRQAAMHCGLIWLMGIPTTSQRPLTVSLHSTNGRQFAVSVVQRRLWNSLGLWDSPSGTSGISCTKLMEYWHDRVHYSLWNDMGNYKHSYEVSNWTF